MLRPEPSPENHFLAEHLVRLCDSYHRLTQKTLTDLSPLNPTPQDLAKAIYYAPFSLLSHGTEPDPIFNYANVTAQRLFEMDWSEFTQLPSRRSAEEVNQAQREKLLATVTQQGFIEGYTGRRISKTGKRFPITHVTIWNVLDEGGNYYGQAAVWVPI
ncbi:MAG: MEKHLA domain-containing protein [Microcystaceae cyanobacterium]